MRVLAVDPGVETGYAYAICEDQQLRYCPTQSVDDVDEVWKRLYDFMPQILVVEDFQFRKGARAGLELFPVQVIGVCRLYALTSPHQVHAYKQSPAKGKSYYTNPTLQQLGLYKRGIPHGLDASRHLLQFFMFGAGNKYIGSKSTQDFVTIVELSEVMK